MFDLLTDGVGVFTGHDRVNFVEGLNHLVVILLEVLQLNDLPRLALQKAIDELLLRANPIEEV